MFNLLHTLTDLQPRLALILLYALHRLIRPLLPHHLLKHLFLSTSVIANADDDTTGYVTGNTACKNHSRQRSRSATIVDPPCRATQGYLKERVEIEKYDNGDEKLDREGAVRRRFMRLKESVTLGHLVLMVF